LGEASGTCYDSTANGYNLTIFGGSPVYHAAGSISTYCMDFNGATKYASRGTGITALTGASFSCWVYFNVLPSTSGDDQYIFRNTHTGSPYTCFDVISSFAHTNNFEFSVHDNLNAAFYLNTGVAPSVSTWYHIVCTVAVGGNMYVYINNTSYSKAAPTNNLLPVDEQTTLGNGYQGATTTGAQARIDEAAFWNRALTAAEVSLLYNGGSGLVYPF
jgi:hypothetical protein